MYKIPKNGATVTIFAPYDCKNNCPFCVNKKEYKENPAFDIEKVKKSIIRMDKITPNCDFVITGGEPLADLDKFEDIVFTISNLNKLGSHHKLYVNTTLPVEKKDIYRLNKLKGVITGFNVSRHINGYVKESDDILFSYLQIPVRINCVLYKEEEGLWAKEIINRYKDIPIIKGFQFRDNYIGVEYDNLYNSNYNIYLNNLLKGLGADISDCEFHYTSFRWDCTISTNPLIKFHRTMCYSKIVYNKIVDENGNQLQDVTEINDVIINPRGEILDDWNEHGQLLDLKKYRKGAKNELRN